METQNNSFNELELDDLRRQINDLKQKVDQQGRLNEDLVKKTIQGKMRKLLRFRHLSPTGGNNKNAS